MIYDFDKAIERRNTSSLKFDFTQDGGKPEDAIPLWVADMDFRAPDCILDALHEAVDHGIFGYTVKSKEYCDAVSAWFKAGFNWDTKDEWLITTPGVVFAISAAIRALTAPGDAVLIQPPVYYPFFGAIRDNNRRIVENQLIYKDGKYSIDFTDFEQKIAENGVKMFILCSPHNPVCRVWSTDELRRMGEICKRYGVTVVSDEIHCDFVFPGHKHTMFPQAVPEMADNCVICTSPSKTFNLAGMQISNIWVSNAEIRSKIEAEIYRCGYDEPNRLGLFACKAAYEKGRDWHEQCKAYMSGNLDYIRAFLSENLPEIRLIEPEGTYFAWLDCSGLGLSPAELNDLMLQKAKLWLDAGEIFGRCAEQFMRIVLACPRSSIEKAMEQLKNAIK